MDLRVRLGLLFVWYALLALPAAAFVTFLMTPFWGWVETQYGIESLGHSGPATWCFLCVYAVMVGVNALILWRRWRGR
ncbi:MAG TPA: hypothetical protein VFI13_09420, partial [Gemmatimonadales bacterium]|nr:hypothetical protein [Gemmatimonadales bacterium]